VVKGAVKGNTAGETQQAVRLAHCLSVTLRFLSLLEALPGPLSWDACSIPWGLCVGCAVVTCPVNVHRNVLQRNVRESNLSMSEATCHPKSSQTTCHPKQRTHLHMQQLCVCEPHAPDHLPPVLRRGRFHLACDLW
jgi:hypothetical protein